jgi:hypothetical protein
MPKIGRGSGPPKPPTPFKFSDGGSDSGGAHGADETGVPVDVALSGGEYVIEPSQIIKRWGNLKNGHAVLDAFVMANRKNEIQTLKKLPPPAKA